MFQFTPRRRFLLLKFASRDASYRPEVAPSAERPSEKSPINFYLGGSEWQRVITYYEITSKLLTTLAVIPLERCTRERSERIFSLEKVLR